MRTVTGRRAAGRALSLIGAGAAALALSLPAAAQRDGRAAGGATNVYFVNGANNSFTQAIVSAYWIKLAYQDRLEGMPGNQGQEFRFGVAYNRSEGLTEDIKEVYRQKRAERDMTQSADADVPFWFFLFGSADDFLDMVTPQEAEDIAFATAALLAVQEADSGPLTQKLRSDLAEGRRVFLIAHSQGNLFANSALAALDRHRDSVGMVGVASAASSVADGFSYTTAYDDFVINTLREDFPDTLAGNIDNDPTPFKRDNRDALKHGFVRSYFGTCLAEPCHWLNPRLDSRRKIDAAVFDAMRKLRFPAPDASLAVMAGGGGSVSVLAGSGDVAIVPAGTSVPVNVPGWATATLTAIPAPGHEFAGWTLSPEGPACAGGADANPCALAAGSVTAGASASAAFERPPAPAPVPAPVPTPALAALAVMAGGGGSVSVLAGSVAAGIPAGSSGSVDVPAGATATLTAEPSSSYQFAGWTLSAGLECAGGAETNPCALAAGSVTADASASAMFAMAPAPSGSAALWKGPGSVSVSSDGSTLTAVPHAPGAFEGWDGAPCEGLKQLMCDVSSVTAGEDLPVAVFRPFGGGVKSLVFGFGYPGAAPDHFRVSFQSALGAGFSTVPELEHVAPGAAPARLSVPVHLHPWSRGSYLVEACDAAETDCVTASNGMRALEQSDSIAATGYFKAPNADRRDDFGWALALSADGSTLAVGAPQEDSPAVGTFAPGDAGYRAALESDGATSSGAAYVYRRSAAGRWVLEAFVKAPNAGRGDSFGGALALSTDGSTLAVGALNADLSGGGAAHVYRARPPGGGRPRPSSRRPSPAPATSSAPPSRCPPTVPRWRWARHTRTARPSARSHRATRATAPRWRATAPQAAVPPTSTAARPPGGGCSKPSSRHPTPVAETGSAQSLALSSSGTVLAVGANQEDSSHTGTFAPGDDGYQAALESDGAHNSGAAYVYRRSNAGLWAIKAFVKAPNAGGSDYFGEAFLALSEDGSVLAVGAPGEDSSYTGTFAPTDDHYQDALGSEVNAGTYDSGGAYVYRRSDGGRWALEAFIKAPVASDGFGLALALSADGAALAVGAHWEGSSATGAFAPSDPAGRPRWTAAAPIAVAPPTSTAARTPVHWSVEAFVKAPNPAIDNYFGADLALSGDGDTLAVGAVFESGGPQTRPLSGLQADVSGGRSPASGAVYLY